LKALNSMKLMLSNKGRFVCIFVETNRVLFFKQWQEGLVIEL